MKRKLSIVLSIVLVLSMTACSNSKEVSSSLAEKSGNNVTQTVSESNDDTVVTAGTDNTASDKTTDKNIKVSTDVKFSEGLEFESNGDGTCSIVGVGNCNDKDVVIPNESPEGDKVTLIKEYSFSDLDSINSVTIVNYSEKIDKRAFQYNEMKKLNILGGNPKVDKSAFSSCEELEEIHFEKCGVDFKEYSFYGCGNNAVVDFKECNGTIDERTFQDSNISSIAISDCNLEIEQSAFSGCDKIVSIQASNSTLDIGEYGFYGVGSDAVVEFTDCSIAMDDRSFQDSSIGKLTVTGEKFTTGKSSFSSCEDLTELLIDCATVDLDEYAFYGCESLKSLSISKDKNDTNIKFDNRAFQDCEKLEDVTIGNGEIELGDSVFADCSEKIKVTIAGKNYSADELSEGLPQ